MIGEKFVRKNELGIEIEYEVLALYPSEDDKEYLIYTDYVPTHDIYKIRHYVDRKIGENKYERLPEKEEKRIIEEFYNDVNKEILKLDDEIQEEKEEKKTKLEELQDKLEEAKKKNNEKDMIHLRGQIIKELNYKIREETKEERKQELEELKKRTLEEHKELINKKYKEDYTKKKKNIPGIITVLPKGIALAFKKVASTIEELKLAKTTKEKTEGILKTLKDGLQLIGTPIDFSMRFAVNHWYLLLLLLNFKFPTIKIPGLPKLKRPDNHQETTGLVASLEAILTQLKEFFRKKQPVSIPQTVYDWGSISQKEEQLAMRKIAEAATTAGKIGSPVMVPGVNEMITETAAEMATATNKIQGKLSLENLAEVASTTRRIETPVTVTGVNEIAAETTNGLIQEKIAIRKASEAAAELASTTNKIQGKLSLEKAVEAASRVATNGLEEISEELQQTMQRIGSEFIQGLIENHKYVIGEDLKDIPIVHSAEDFIKHVKEINPKAPITEANAIEFYNDYFRGIPTNVRQIIWPEVDEELHYFGTREELVQHILTGKNTELTEYFENYENQAAVGSLLDNAKINGITGAIAKNLGISTTTAAILFALAYGAGKITEVSLVGPLALHP